MTNILVIIDPEETEHSALNRVKELPPTADINYKVDLYLDVQPVLARDANSSSDRVKQAIEERKAWLEELVRPFKELGYRIECDLKIINRLYEDIIKSAKRFKADFVFKPLRQHGVLKRAFYTSTDWNLIRLCPTPLLLVSDAKDVRGRPIIAAIDVGDEDDAHKELNRVVAEQANVLSDVLDAPVHLVYAYGPAVVSSQAAVGDPLAYQVIRGKFDEELKAAVSLGSEFGINQDNVHLREGAPGVVLNDIANEIGAGVTVIGTVARSGASGLFIGNTAEAVLEKTETDIFVLKPASFKPPV